jgi:hypothetical protein
MHCPVPHSDQKTGQMPSIFVLDPLSGLASSEVCHPVRVKIEDLVKASGPAQTQNDSYSSS